MCSRQEEIHSAMCGSENMVRLTKWFPKNDALGYVFGKLRLAMCFRKNNTFGDVFSEKRYVCDVFSEKRYICMCFQKNDTFAMCLQKNDAKHPLSLSVFWCSTHACT